MTTRKPYPTTSKTAAYKVRTRGLNKPLLLKLARHIERHPEQYDQGKWYADKSLEEAQLGAEEVGAELHVHKPKAVCGTVACVAGHTVVQSGTPLIKLRQRSWGTTYESLDWSLTAQYTLGLSEELATWLFSADRSEESMPTVLRAIANGQTDTHVLRVIEYEYA